MIRLGSVFFSPANPYENLATPGGKIPEITRPAVASWILGDGDKKQALHTEPGYSSTLDVRDKGD